MEQNSDIENEYNGDTLFDGSMLDKLRSCSIIPRSLTDFQVFVRGLTGDPISDTVVQEVWKKIYSETATEIESESSEPKLPMSCTVVGYNNTAPSLQSLDTDSKKVTKRKGLTHSGLRIVKNVKRSCSENEIDTSMTKNYEQFASTSGEKMPHPNTNTCNDHNVATPSRSVDHSSRKEGKRRLPYFPRIRIPQQKNEIDDDVIAVEEQEEEGSSSDCEVIEIVSVHKTNNDASGDITFTGPQSDSECNESHSEKSVEILEPLYEHSIGNVCPVHGGKGHFNSLSSPVSDSDSEEISNCIDKRMYKLHVQTDYNHQNNGIYQKSLNKEKQEKVKKGKRGKYKILRTEVQCLKSLLVNLLTSLKNPTIDNGGKKTEVTSQGDSLRLLENQRRGKKKRSFHRKKARVEGIDSEVASTKRQKTSAFVEVNMSKEKTMLHEKKQNVKYTEPCDKTYESFPKIRNFDLSTRNFNNVKRKKFLWREIITDSLKLKTSNQMPLEELKRSVIAKYYYYRGNVSQNTSVKFFRYLHSTAGVVVDGDMVNFSNKKITKVSSKSGQKKQFVMKTVTTRKEYKVS